MPEPNINIAGIAKLIQDYEPNIEHRSNRVAQTELKNWTAEEVTGVLKRLSPRASTKGSSEPCGPEFNKIDRRWKSILLIHLGIWSIISLGTAVLLPIQLGAALYLTLRRKFSPIWHELPKPTTLLFDWATGLNAFVKAPKSLIKKSIEQRKALCVNCRGYFMLRESNYAVLSHVWGETMGWATKDTWGPVELGLRKKGIAYHHFQRFFHRCESEWLWVDVLAMPEIYEDMSSAEKASTEALRTGVINCLRNIITRADKVVCLDSLLLRLRSSSMVDAAVILTLGRWIGRLWTFTEAKLAKRVILKTEDSAYDLDEIMTFFYEVIENEEHRYFHIFARLAPLRPVPEGFRSWLGYLCRPNTYDQEITREIYWGCENRLSDVEIDQARALFPVLGLEWKSGWTLGQGLKHILEEVPDDQSYLLKYIQYRDIQNSLLDASGYAGGSQLGSATDHADRSDNP